MMPPMKRLYGSSVTIPDAEFIKNKHRKGYINYLIQSEARRLAEMETVNNKYRKKKKHTPYEELLKMVGEKYKAKMAEYEEEEKKQRCEIDRKKGKEYYWSNKETILSKAKAYRKANPDIVHARDKAYREASASKLKAQNVRLYATTRGLGLEIMEKVRTMGEGDRMFFAMRLLFLSYIKIEYRQVMKQYEVDCFINDYHPDLEGYLRETLGPVQY
jgi:HD superfamily phosphohydrolase